MARLYYKNFEMQNVDLWNFEPKKLETKYCSR